MSALGIALGVGAARPGAWWPHGTELAADFARRRYMARGRQVALGQAMSFARHSVGTAMTEDGICAAFASGAPRLGAGGLLLEGAAENALRRSSGFGDTDAWTAEGNAAVTGNTMKFGALVLEECAVAAPGAFPKFRSADSLVLADGQYGVISLFAIAGAASPIRTHVFDGSGNTASAWTTAGGGFTKDGTIENNPEVTAFVGDGAEAVGNGVWRLWTSFRNVSGGPLAYQAAPHLQGTTGVPAMASACWMGGLQLEKGRWPTSPIVTAGSPAARAADGLSADMALGPVPSLALAARWLGGDPDSSRLVSLGDGTGDNELGVYLDVA